MILFSKTCIKDLPWLEIAMKSVKKFCKDKVEWHIVIEDNDIPSVWGIINRVNMEDFAMHVYPLSVKWPEATTIRDGYLVQQWVKMTAHRVIGDNFAWNWDSDVLAVRPFTQESFMQNGKPVMWYSEFNALIIGGYPKDRKDWMAKFFGRECSNEYMRCMPIVMMGRALSVGEGSPVWAKFLDACRAGDKSISEFCVMGEFNNSHFAEHFTFKNAELEGPTWGGGDLVFLENRAMGEKYANTHFDKIFDIKDNTRIIHQAWSWGGITPEISEFAKSL